MKPFAILVFLAVSGCQSDPCSLNTALQSVEQTIKDGLRSPSSAVFQKVDRDTVTGSEDECKYTFSGTFDADNMYGASIRHSFEVSVSVDETTQKHVMEFKHITAR